MWLKLTRWVQSWRRRREIMKAAARVVESEGSSQAAMIKAAVVLDALKNRRPLCQHCLNPYEHKERTFAENFQVRSILMLPSDGPDPMLCDGCYNKAIRTFNQHATNVGTSNNGHDNLVLKHFS